MRDIVNMFWEYMVGRESGYRNEFWGLGIGVRIVCKLDFDGWLEFGQLGIEKVGKVGEEGASTSVKNERKVCVQGIGSGGEECYKGKRKKRNSFVIRFFFKLILGYKLQI